MAIIEHTHTHTHTHGLELLSDNFAQMAKEAGEETSSQDDTRHVYMGVAGLRTVTEGGPSTAVSRGRQGTSFRLGR